MRTIKVILGDCMDVMQQYEPKYFDLAVVDPPYGIGLIKTESGNWGIRKENNENHSKQKDWDFSKPTIEYIVELFRVSKDQILFGANHYIEVVPYNSTCWIVWDKENGDNYFADCELAWTSFKTATRKAKIKWGGANSHREGKRIHECQKPVALYDWIYQKYLPQGGKVLDTHGGSMSNVISWIKAGNIDGVCVEIDPDYFGDAKKRIQNFLAQQDMFRNPVTVKFIEL